MVYLCQIIGIVVHLTQRLEEGWISDLLLGIRSWPKEARKVYSNFFVVFLDMKPACPLLAQKRWLSFESLEPWRCPRCPRVITSVSIDFSCSTSRKEITLAYVTIIFLENRKLSVLIPKSQKIRQWCPAVVVISKKDSKNYRRDRRYHMWVCRSTPMDGNGEPIPMRYLVDPPIDPDDNRTQQRRHSTGSIPSSAKNQCTNQSKGLS